MLLWIKDSDGTHSLQRIHCWASDEMLNFSKSDEETNPSTSQLAWRWGHFNVIFNFWMNYSVSMTCEASACCCVRADDTHGSLLSLWIRDVLWRGTAVLSGALSVCRSRLSQAALGNGAVSGWLVSATLLSRVPACPAKSSVWRCSPVWGLENHTGSGLLTWCNAAPCTLS